MLRAISRPILLHFKSKNLAVSSASKTLYLYSSPKSIAVGISSHFTPHFRNSVIKIKASSQFNTRYMSTPVNSPLITEQEVTGNAAPQVELLTSANDDFGGVIVHMKEPMDPQVFISSLRASMLQWRLQGIKGVWIKLPIGHANLVEAAVKEGFWYHHAEKTYLMLVNWIHETACTIPANATHRVGIGAFVINDKREVLVVQEKSGRFRGTGLWKFPTGVVDEGEDISVAAVREVKEETGIDAEFVEVLAFRQSHKAFFGKSDLFFVCMMRPLSFNIQKQEEEIEAAEWMPIEEYAIQPFVQNHGLLKYMIDIGLAAVNGKYAGFLPVPTSSMFAKDHSYLYLNHQDLSKSVNSGNKL